MTQNVENLKKKYDEASNASKKNEKSTEALKKQYEDASDSLEKTKKYLEEYFSTNNEEILDAQEKWYEYKNAISDIKDEIGELKRNLSLTPFTDAVQETEYALDRMDDRIELLDLQNEFAEGADETEYLNKKIDLYNEKLRVAQEEYQRLKALAGEYQKYIWKYGFELDENSLIKNYDEVLKKLTGTKEYETAKKYADEYMKVVRDDLIDIQIEALKTKNSIEEINRAMAEEAERQREEAERARKEAEDKRWEQFFEKINNSLQEMEYNLDRCKDKLDLLDAGHERSQGSTKLNYLNERVRLLNEQLSTTEKSLKTVNDAKKTLQGQLWQFGFSIDQNGLIGNYDEILNMLIANEETYDRAKKLADEYMSLVRGDLIDLQVESLETQNEIKEMLDEIEKLERELKLFSGELDLTILNQEFENLETHLNIINDKLEYAFGTDKIDLMKESLVLLNKELKNQEKQAEATKKQLGIYQQDLMGYGFEIDTDGNISNYKEIMEFYQNHEDIEKLKDLTEEYFDLHKELTDISESYSELQKEIKDAYREQLEVTEDIEKEITKIIEKEFDRRKEELEDYTNAQVKLLEKQKDAYQDLRKEQNYEKNLKEQTQEIEELQERIETARKDTSISGQKRLSELLKELEEAQKELAETTQDKIDDDFDKNIDDEIDKLEEERELLLKELEEQFSETNIAKIVSEVLKTGFIEIDGEVQRLQEALLDSINNSAEGYSVMADVIKNELVANLNVALDTMGRLADINKELGLNNYSIMSDVSTNLIKTPTYDNDKSEKTIAIGDTVINVTGSVDEVTLDKIEEMIKESQNQMLNEITQSL